MANAHVVQTARSGRVRLSGEPNDQVRLQSHQGLQAGFESASHGGEVGQGASRVVFGPAHQKALGSQGLEGAGGGGNEGDDSGGGGRNTKKSRRRP